VGDDMPNAEGDPRVYLEMHRLEDRLKQELTELRANHAEFRGDSDRRHHENLLRLDAIDRHINQTLGAYNALRYIAHILAGVGGAIIAFIWDRLTTSPK
jgi:hypothetical protein